MKSSRKKRSRDEKMDHQKKRIEKQERDKIICYQYARCRNASRVAKEHGVSHVYVLRAWNRLSEEERDALFETREQVDEELNEKLLQAERIAGDTFIANLVFAREKLGRELVRRCTGDDIRTLSDKDFTSLLRLVATVTAPEEEKEEQRSENSTLRAYRQAIREEIETQKTKNS